MSTEEILEEDIVILHSTTDSTYARTIDEPQSAPTVRLPSKRSVDRSRLEAPESMEEVMSSRFVAEMEPPYDAEIRIWVGFLGLRKQRLFAGTF